MTEQSQPAPIPLARKQLGVSEEYPVAPPPKSGANAALSTVFVALITSAIAMGGQYLITYKNIEEPKIKIEEKKAAIEAHKQALTLAPNITTLCKSNVVDPWSWRVVCSYKNTSTYAADIKFTDIKVSVLSDPTEVKYENGFAIEHPNGMRSFRSSPGSERYMWFYLRFDKKIYPDGIQKNYLYARITHGFETIKSAQTYITGQFPELNGIILDIAQQSPTDFAILAEN